MSRPDAAIDGEPPRSDSGRAAFRLLLEIIEDVPACRVRAVARSRIIRIECGIEIDGHYVDTAIQRWERFTGRKAQNSEGKTFAQVKLERIGEQ